MLMNKKQVIISVIITMVIMIFAVFSPRYILSTRTLLTLQRSDENASGYQGIIYVWHIAGFKPYQGSLGSWISKTAAQLEKKHSGVYLEVDSITLDEYAERIARGELPDVFSYPLGCMYVEQLKELTADDHDFKGNLESAGKYNSAVYGVPYAASGYVTVHNQRLMQEEGADIQVIADMLKSGAANASGDYIQAYIWGYTGEILSIEDFIEEKAVSAFVDARTVGDLARKVQNGKGFPFETAPCSSYSDLVQLIGVNVNIDPVKLPYIYEFIDLCLSEENQRTLKDLGLMPVLAEINTEKAEDEAVNQLFEELEDIAAPNSFLYKTYRDQLEISAAEAMRGSASAKKDLDLRLTELVRGAAIK